jgi:hypothetical protein
MTFISNRHAATLRFGTVTTKHIANGAGLPICGVKRSRQMYTVSERDPQFVLCQKCDRIARFLKG